MRLSVAVLLLCCNVAWASPESEAFKRAGLEELKGNRHERALEQFQQAVKADAADLDAAFFLAATYNRMGRHGEAYDDLFALEDRGYRNAEVDFEIGWALAAAEQADDCVVRLERYRQSVPARALALEFLGRCRLLSRDYDKAEAALREAKALDPASAPRVDLMLAQVKHARGDTQAASTMLADIMRGDTDIGRALRRAQAAVAAAAAPGTGWKLWGSAAFGHNSNVIALGNTTPLPADITGKGSGFLRAGFGISNSAQIDGKTLGSAGYGLLFDRYEAIGSANLDDHYLYADVTHQLNPQLALSLRASMQLTYLDGTQFRTQPALRAAAAYRFTPNSATEVAYAFAAADYAKPATLPAFDRNGDNHTLSINHLLRPAGSPWSGSIGVAYADNRTEGSDFRSSSTTASGVLRYAFGGKIDLAVGGSVGRERYRNPNSLSAAAVARRDNPKSVFAQLSGPLTDKLRYYVQLQSGHSDSNISFYDYRQRTVVGGVSIDF
jgi:Tfp pilus assembly protein PilF